MRVQILSDLHLEIERTGAKEGEQFYTYDVPVRAEHLALLGDIGWTINDELFDWLRKQLKVFKTVFFVPGNHEPYRSTVAESETRLTKFAQDTAADPSIPGNFILLNRTRYDVSPTLTILGCTLWAALNPDDLDILSWALTDFKRIDGLNPDSFVAMHNADRAWLNNTVQDIAKNEPARQIAIFTHHAPTIDGVGDPKFNDQPTNSAFASEMTGDPCWLTGNVKFWAFGHTHWPCDFERKGVRVYSNQRGYREGTDQYDKEKVVEISGA